MQVNRQRRAVPFIIKNEHTNQYELTKQAEQLLKGIDKNLSIVSVAGQYRTGKSYLLNSVILDKKSIFGVGPTVNPCTKGLWLWVQPDPTTQKRQMLVIDTQGLGALDEQSNHDMKIFCLAVLLSTTFIYNSVGSIDENALQSLSLVLNLVNNIDQENTSNRPQFIWVVRDFTLQLVDEKGKVLTPQQYLEMALTTNTKQQQKVTIRKTITNAFSRRDCFTLVKPLIDENKLQNLDQISMDELRPEFVSQSIELRNRIKSALKQFSLTSSKNHITGKEYIIVVEKYLAAINSGAVPNMIDTWTFIKEQKSRQALEQIKKVYTEKIKNKIMSKIPMKKNHLQEHFKNLKEQIKSTYIKMTFQESCTEPVDEFIKSIYNQVQKINTEQNRQYIKNMLNKQYEPFMKKLYSQYYNSYEDFEIQISKNYKQVLIEKFQDRIDDIKENIERYADQKLIENFKYFEKKLKQQVRTAKAIKIQLETTLNKQIMQSNEIRQKQRRINQQKLFQLQKRIRIYENEREQIIEFGKSEKQLIETNTQLLKKKNEQLNSTIEDQARQINNMHSTQNLIKQKHFIELKQFQKQKALFSQKEEYLNSRIRELEQKSGDLSSKINQAGGKFEMQKKGIVKQYQQKIQSLDQQNKRLTEKMSETENKLGKILDEAKEMAEQIQSLKQSNANDKKKLEVKILQAQSNKKPSKLEHDLKEQNSELMIELAKANERNNEASKRIKTIQQEIKSQQNNYQKQIAIHVQQIQFQQIQITDLKERYEELKKSYQNALENLHDSSKNQQNSLQIKIYELKNEHQNELKNLGQQYEQGAKLLKKQIQILQKSKQDLILQSSLDKKHIENKQKQWKESNNMLQSMIRKLEERLQSSEKDYQDVSKEKQSFFSIRMRQLEQQLQEVKQKTSLQIAENTKKSEHAFVELRQISQMQKAQWQKRLSDEKQKTERRIKNMRDEHDKKLIEQRTNFEQQISELQGRLAHLQRVYNQKLQHLQYDHDIALQKITIQFNDQKVHLTKQLALAQQNIQVMTSNYQKQLQTQAKHHEKIIETCKANLKRQYEETLKRLSEERQIYLQKCETLKKQNRQVQQNNLVLKSQIDKQRAVYKQKEKTFNSKIFEFQNRLQSELTTYNRTIQTINQRHSIQITKLNDQIDKLNSNVAILQQERDKIDTEHQNQILRLEKKLKVLQDSKIKNKQDYEDIVSKFQTAVTHFGNQKKKLIQQKQKIVEDVSEKYNENIKQVEDGHKKMLKQSQDRIARLLTQNKSLKERLMIIEIQKSTNSNTTAKKPLQYETEKQRLDKKYEKRIQQYKQLYQKQKQKCRRLKQQNQRFRTQLQSNSSFIHGSSTITYNERPSISQISNSRLYNGGTTESKRKFTNTPLLNPKSKMYDPQQQHSVLRFNQGTGYRGRD